ncbi:DNA repair protein RecN [uncultured Sphingomonas sp.]|uniref:DNA repair protein RecN n=1 Tax=uncultured Sphingomonas sp. TaxID=158754 RepID=UPI0025E55552|nr:DNA repair protein RecN [uncultured Sphingomonas sp.]
MLTSLAIRDIVLIEALDLEFGPGLGALTGETGAGKSILLDALGLALGMRADAGLVRQGAQQAGITASFDIPGDHPALALLADGGLEVEPGEPLVIRRSLRADGGSRAFVNSQPASAGLLRTLGATLIEVHGQHDDRGLLNRQGHRALLDVFGRIDTRPTATAYARWREAEQAHDTALSDLQNAARDREWLDHAVQELTAAAAEPGEEATLAEARATMQKGAKLADELETAAVLLEGSDGGLALLRQAARRIDRLAGEHEALALALEAIDRAVIEASDAEERLGDARAAFAFDPARLEAMETRLFDLRALARKHRVEPDQLAALTDELAARLARIEAGGDGIATLERAAREAQATYVAAAKVLAEKRRAAAKRLDAAVATELKPLRLDAARFRTTIESLPQSGWSAAGQDRVEFEISTNPGAPFAPLAKIASGGELSRFILALKVALAEEGGAGTMIFDEVDRGVGGAVAAAIGERLARLATRAQILVVTHSPQVAARADRHWLIQKRSDGIVARTGVHMLDPGERREEIARMLSGAEVTDEARAQAQRLLAAA